MKAYGLNRRLATLEAVPVKEELVPFSFQWMKEDGAPAGPMIRRMVPKGRFKWLNEA
jgi:hypothetical protein